MNYEEFVRSKTHSTGSYGFEPEWMPYGAFDFQQAKINLELASKRFEYGVIFKQDALFVEAEIE